MLCVITSDRASNDDGYLIVPMSQPFVDAARPAATAAQRTSEYGCRLTETGPYATFEQPIVMSETGHS